MVEHPKQEKQRSAPMNDGVSVQIRNGADQRGKYPLDAGCGQRLEKLGVHERVIEIAPLEKRHDDGRLGGILEVTQQTRNCRVAQLHHERHLTGVGHPPKKKDESDKRRKQDENQTKHYLACNKIGPATHVEHQVALVRTS
jgi:hypothetical protein